VLPVREPLQPPPTLLKAHKRSAVRIDRRHVQRLRSADRSYETSPENNGKAKALLFLSG
jgi:hypothetical protein